MENIKFEQLGICPEIQKAVKYMGFEEASPIQAKAIPVILEGKDIIGQAQTEQEKQRHLVFRFYKKLIRKTRSYRGLYFVRRENWQFRWLRKSET